MHGIIRLMEKQMRNPFSLFNEASLTAPTAPLTDPSSLDDNLEMLIASSSVSAKAALVTALLPLEEPAPVNSKLVKHLSGTDLDEMLSMCAVMDEKALSVAAASLNSATLRPSYSWDDFRHRALYSAALAPVVAAFAPHDTAPELNLHIHAIVKYMGKRIQLGQTPEVIDLGIELSIARGACVRSFTSGIMIADEASDAEMFWLGENHRSIAPLAPVLIDRGSSDTLLITDLLREASLSLASGVL